MIENEYEVISHNNSNFHLFLVNLLYRTPHIHKDYEISLVLEGTPTLITPKGTVVLFPNDIFITNPFMGHEIKAPNPALILSLQLSPAFFYAYYPQIEHTDFDIISLNASQSASVCSEIRGYLFQLAAIYFRSEENAAIKCAILVNQLFLRLLETQPHHLLPEKEKQAFQLKGQRMRNIIRYIDAHYTEKILLSHIAGQEGLSLHYLSHFFKDCFGISFQNYVSKVRCEHACQLVLMTDYSLLDISISCGFSDPKYFNKAFLSQYGCTPKECRRNFQAARIEQRQMSMLTTQEFLSREASLSALQRYMDRI